jgi:hypothetical protein
MVTVVKLIETFSRRFFVVGSDVVVVEVKMKLSKGNTLLFQFNMCTVSVFS